jgi:antitoxin VapB
MLATAKVFTNGNSQAIRLPKAFRVDVDEMWIARNEVTGEITLKPKDTETLRKRRLDALMAAIADNPLPDDFLSDASRQNHPPKNPFVDWAELEAPKVSAKVSAKVTVKSTVKRTATTQVRK